MDVPDDILKVASNIVTGFCVGRGQCIGFNENEWLETTIRAALLAQDKAATERAAKIAETWESPLRPGTEARLLGHQDAARSIAAAIRSQP